MSVSQHIKEHAILGVKAPGDTLHTNLSDMPDTLGTNTDHDARYYPKGANVDLGTFDLTTTGKIVGTQINGTVIHGATADTARPTGYTSVFWIGSVEPTNAIDNDVWFETS